MSKEEFCSLIKKLVDNPDPDGAISIRELANVCDASLQTVRRWYNGDNAPHPAMREFLVKVLSENYGGI
jgi:hypothetical protein